MGSSFTLYIQTPKESFIHEEVTRLQLPGGSGVVGILPRHAPMIFELTSGLIHVVKDHKTSHYFVNPGIAYVTEGNTLILTEQSKPLNELDPMVLNEELEQSHQTLAGLDVGYEYRFIERKIKILQSMLREAKKYP